MSVRYARKARNDSNPNPNPNPQPNWRRYQGQPSRSNLVEKIAKVIYFLLILAGLWFAFMNIKPYAEVTGMLLSTLVDDSLLSLLSKIPIINGLMNTLGNAVNWVIGALLWAAIQLLEVFPMVVKRDRQLLRSVIETEERDEKFDLSTEYDPLVAKLKGWYNRFPTASIRTLQNLAVFMYVIDFLICVTVYPPADGGFTNFMFLLITGQWAAFDWLNIVLILVTLFAVEFILSLLFLFGQIAFYYKHSRP